MNHLSTFVRTAMVFESGLLAFAFGLGWFLDSPPFQQCHFSWQITVYGAIATVPPLLLLLFCTHSQWKPLAQLTRDVEDNILPLFEHCSLTDFALISIVAGVAEEALFRGVIQPELTNLFDPWKAIVITGILFGLLHFITPTYAVLAGLIGVYLGLLMNASETLWLPIIVHVLYDSLALTYLVRRLQRKRSELA